MTLTSGYAASPVHYQSGGGANYICLPDIPSFAAADTAADVQTSVVGVRYNTMGEPLGDLNGQAVRCAVCSTTQAVQFMLPGTTACPSDWNMAYNGYLMSAGDTLSDNLTPVSLGEDDPPSTPTANFRTEYICVCGEPDTSPPIPDAEAELYHVHVDCAAGASLGCNPPELTLDQLACAVCTLPFDQIPTAPA